jgi:hypothetical protein
MKRFWELAVQIHILTSAIFGGKWLNSPLSPGGFIPG